MVPRREGAGRVLLSSKGPSAFFVAILRTAEKTRDHLLRYPKHVRSGFHPGECGCAVDVLVYGMEFNTLLTIAQMLDIGSAQSDFGPPSDWLTLAYQRFESRVIDDPSLLERLKANRVKWHCRFDLTPTILGLACWRPRQ